MNAPIPEDSAEDLYENTPCGYLSTLPDGTIFRVNQTFLNLTGHTRAELLAGRRVQELMSVPGRVFYETHFAPLLRLQGSVKEIACDLLRPGRAPLPALLNAVEVRAVDGKVTQIRFVVFDASDRRRYEEELVRARQRAEHYAAIVKASADAILSIGPDGTVQTWNAGAERLFGYTAGEAVGRAVVELIVPEVDAEEMGAVVAELGAGRAVRRETICTGRDGRRVHVSVSLTPHLEPPGELTGVSAILRDITERKRAEAELQAGDQRIRLATEATGVGIWEWNLASGRVHWDAQMFRIYGIPPTADGFVPYSEWRETVHPDEIHAQEEILQDTARRCGHSQREFRIRRRGDAEWHLIQSVETVRTNAEGEAEWVVGTNLDITESRQAETVLRESEERMALGVKVAGFALANVDYTTDTIRLSAEAARLFGVGDAATALPRAKVHATVHPEDREELMRRIAAALSPAGAGWFAIDHRVIWPDGAVRWVRVRKQVFFDGEGADRRPIRSVIAALDVTAEKATAAAVVESEERFRSTFEHAAIGIAHVALDGRWMSLNPKFCAIVGYSAEELADKTFGDITHPDDLDADLAQVRRLLAGEIVTYTMEKRYIRKDGSTVWVNLTASLLRDAAGQPRHFIAAVEDISARKHAEESLVTSEERFRKIFEHAATGIAFKDHEGRYIQCNAAYAAMLGYTAAELREVVYVSLVHPDDRAANTAAIQRLLDGKAATFEIENRYVHKNGEPVWVHKFVSILRGDSAAPPRLVALVSDVTARRLTEAALHTAKEAAEAANRSKDRFLAVLSHELRTPLTPVLMTVGALEHDPELRADVREDLVMIKRNIELEARLIDDLLDVSRIASGKLPLKITSVDLNTAVRHVCDNCRPQLFERNVRLEVTLCDDAGVVAADVARLQQVLWNVLKNAIKFTPAQGTIHVSSVRLTPDRCEVRVRDTGMGIPPEVLPRIFNAFEQGEAGVTREFGGLGLGLAISMALIELHGGTIRAESAGRGQGATFIIELPGEHRPAAPAAAPVSTDPAAPRQLRLLIVEDHADTARALRTLLTRAGFAVQTAGDVATALALAARETFDVLISDLGLPDGTGHDVITGVRKLQPLPAIAMSGYGMEEDVRTSHAAGFKEHIVKPVEVPQLLAAIARVVEMRA